MDEFRRFFFRGLAALVPTLLTIAIVVWAYHFVNEHVGYYITSGLQWVCLSISQEPAPGLIDEDEDALAFGTPIPEWRRDGRQLTVEYKIIHNNILQRNPGLGEDVWARARQHARKARSRALWQIAFAKYRLHWLGFLIAIVVVYFTGFFLASLIGRSVWRAMESLLYRMPLIRAIYPNVKQVTDFLLSDRKTFESSGVVAVQYPRKGVWSVGLSTGSGLAGLPPLSHADVKGPGARTKPGGAANDGGADLVAVFIPSSPTPVTGYVIQVPRSDVVRLNISIDEALRFTVSGGVIKPGALLGKAGRASGNTNIPGNTSSADDAGDVTNIADRPETGTENAGKGTPAS